MNRQGVVTGWDIGGAHLKVAVADQSGLVQVDCIATPVWQGVDVIEAAMNESMATIKAKWTDVSEHRVTMTAELVDVFLSREDGVAQIVALTQRCLGPAPVRYLDVDAALYESKHALAQPFRFASANWVAPAKLASSQFRAGVVVDIGTTTTDITCFADGHVISAGSSDLQRSRDQTLIYLGVVRTPVCAWVDEIEFAGHTQGVAAEYFANAADVYRIIDRLPADADQGQTCDGRGKTKEESRDRLARVLLTDSACHGPTQWHEVCQRMANLQSKRIERAIDRQLKRHLLERESIVLVGAGVGRFLLAPIAEKLGISYHELAGVSAAAIDSLPAAALALWPESIAQGDS